MRLKLQENPVLEYPDLAYVRDFAKKKHDSTYAVRKSTLNPYFEHPQMVADVVTAYGGTEEEIAASLLHDTLEDTDATFEEIEAVYGRNIADLVEELTNDPIEKKALGKEEYINRKLLNLSEPALFIKLADMYANTLDHPKEGQAERIANNIDYLIKNRDDISSRCWELLTSFPQNKSYNITIDSKGERLSASRKINRNKLIEKVLSYYRQAGISNLTRKHYNIRLEKNYTYGLKDVVIVGDKHLRLVFDVSPTFFKGTPIKNQTGKPQKSDRYLVEIQFVNADKYLELSDVSFLDASEIRKGLQDIYKNCNLQFYSDDPSFYYQGFWEGLDKVASSIYPFKGVKGKDIWKAKHAASGGLLDADYRVTKHITQILIDLDNYTNKIIKKLENEEYKNEKIS